MDHISCNLKFGQICQILLLNVKCVYMNISRYMERPTCVLISYVFLFYCFKISTLSDSPSKKQKTFTNKNKSKIKTKNKYRITSRCNHQVDLLGERSAPIGKTKNGRFRNQETDEVPRSLKLERVDGCWW